MRLVLACLTLAAGLAAADNITIGRWNGMLLVTAPADNSVGALGARLTQRITLEARDQPLTEIAAFLRQATGLNLIVAPALLAQPPSISMQVKDMELRNVLSWLERTAGIHIGFQHGALYFSDQPVAGATRTRLYDVSDLALPLRHFPGPELTIPQAGGGSSSLLLAPTEPADDQRVDLDQIEELLKRLSAAR